MKRLLLVLVGAVLFCSHLLYASSNELCAEELSSTNFQEGDYIALRALYLSTDGDNWTDNSGWPDAAFFNANPTLPAGINPVSWLGINLDDNGCLSSLYLNDNNLVGNIPPEIGNFSTLIRLWLHDNQLSGNIPPEIGNILSLDGLVLRNNQLTGNIPPEIGNLANLHSLVLSNNQLTGSLPKTLGNLLLNNFHVFNNQLSGCYHSDLTPLCDAWISILDDPDNADVSDGNNFDVPWEDFCDSGSGICVVSCTDGDYTALRALYLSTDGDNWTNNSGWPSADDFTANVLMPAGTDASTWYGVTTDAGGCVTALNLSNNMLIGSVPAEIEELNDLTSLNLSDNALSGGIPAEIGNLSNLTQLDLSSNTLNGIPTEIGNLSNLTVLNLANNTFIGGIPTEIGNLINLTNLNLANSTLTGYIPSVLGNLTNLTDLNLSYNQLLDCYHPNLVSLCTQLNNSTTMPTSLMAITLTRLGRIFAIPEPVHVYHVMSLNI